LQQKIITVQTLGRNIIEGKATDRKMRSPLIV